MRKKKIVLLSMYWSSDAEEMLGNKHYFRELQPWVQETINLFKNKTDVELHVVAPNFASNTDVETIKDGIYFHFFNYAPRILCSCVYPLVRLLVKHDEPHKVSERTVNLFTDFALPKKKIPAIINRIQPDLIHLYGSENPDYAVGVLPFLNSNIPVLLSVQGYAYLLKMSNNRFLNRNARYRIKYEKIINTNVKYITNYGLDYGFEPFENGQKKYVLSAISFVISGITQIKPIVNSENNRTYLCPVSFISCPFPSLIFMYTHGVHELSKDWQITYVIVHIV